MEGNIQGEGRKGIPAVENLLNLGLLELATPARRSPASSELLFTIGEGFVVEQKCMQNSDDVEPSFRNGFEKGANYIPAVEFCDHGNGNGCSNGCVFDNKTYQNYSVENSVENGEEIDVDYMHDFLGVDPNLNSNLDDNGNSFTTPPLPSHGDGIAESGPERKRKRKKTETDAKRKARVREKKHRPKIFDVMKPKKKAPKPKSEKKKQKPKSEKKLKEAKKQESGKRGRKRRKTLDSDNDIQLRESSCVSDPQTPELSEKTHHLFDSSSEESGCKMALEWRKPQVLQVYTRRSSRNKKIKDFDLNMAITDSDFCDQLKSMVWGVGKCKKKRKRRRKATVYAPFLETPFLENSEHLRELLPSFKQYTAAMMEPRHFRCVLSLKPLMVQKNKRLKRLGRSAFINSLAVRVHVPKWKRKLSIIVNRRCSLQISNTSDCVANLNQISGSKMIPFLDLNVPLKTIPFLDLNVPLKTIPLLDLNVPPREERQEQENVVHVVSQETRTQLLLPCSEGFDGRMTSMMQYNDPKSTLTLRITESYVIPKVLNCQLHSLMDDLIRKMNYLTINGKQIVVRDQSCDGALVSVKGRARKKKKPEPPKVIPDEDAMKTWILIKEDGKEKNEENYWKEQKEIFCGRVQMFIRCMHLIQGNRTFSRWKGSVVDSVIGVFLTQNVSDNMSSDCFMRFVARFPKHVDTPNREGVTPKSLEGVTCSGTPPNKGVRDDEGETPISLEGVTNSGSPPNKGVREDEGENPKNLEGVTSEESTTTNAKRKKTKLPKKEPEIQQNWEELRKEYDTIPKDTTCDIEDSVDWDAVRRASTHDVAETVGKRGMKNVLARIIKKFLDRLQEDHGKIDLEWLRNVPTEKVREYLLSFERIGLKSLDCVRLLTLHHHAFPVDTNVGRIVVRLGWVPLQPLPHGVELHLLNDYPILAAIQEYLWPRLNALDQQTLYELHYQMITFGKVFCTKLKPRCHVCPMRKSCKHFASAQSGQLRLPSAQDKANEVSKKSIASSMEPCRSEYQKDEIKYESQNVAPIVKLPESPKRSGLESSESPERSGFESPEIDDIEDLCREDSNSNSEEFIAYDLTQIEKDSNLSSEALVLLAPEATSFPVRKLKDARRLHTEHQVYVLPDHHPLLAQFGKRENDDPVHYLLAIWISDTDKEHKEHEDEDQTVPGTILIPCRTANRGRFALNGTYFQVNEVFADYETSIDPIRVPRSLLWNLPKRIIYCAPSGRSIFRDMSLLEIHNCFWNGYICVRSFDRRTREPSVLHSRFHSPKELQKKDTNSVNNNNNKKKKAEPKPKPKAAKGKGKKESSTEVELGIIW